MATIKEQALKYLGYGNNQPDRSTALMIDESIARLDKDCMPKFIAHIFVLQQKPLCLPEIDLSLEYKSLKKLFKGCDRCMAIAATLGVEQERITKRYSTIDMAKAVVFDTVSSAYLEAACDEYEDSLCLGSRTFRFAPGYGDVPLSMNVILADVLDIHRRIGAALTPAGLFIPQKTMIGLIGLGSSNQTKSCDFCSHFNDCGFRKKGETCY